MAAKTTQPFNFVAKHSMVESNMAVPSHRPPTIVPDLWPPSNSKHSIKKHAKPTEQERAVAVQIEQIDQELVEAFNRRVLDPNEKVWQHYEDRIHVETYMFGSSSPIEFDGQISRPEFVLASKDVLETLPDTTFSCHSKSPDRTKIARSPMLHGWSLEMALEDAAVTPLSRRYAALSHALLFQELKAPKKPIKPSVWDLETTATLEDIHCKIVEAFSAHDFDPRSEVWQAHADKIEIESEVPWLGSPFACSQVMDKDEFLRLAAVQSARMPDFKISCDSSKAICRASNLKARAYRTFGGRTASG
ncbi:hypothetical protein PRZ48_010666 [Zasmidium cellare]|uniref:Uncharacterized protein n=1 Tax=Zasmidium cellare TaxID=395010 RepID=A0ABR0E9U7_ZASCE|nr:hypothetical protein PRZ48_010666 [Zasmidium cellare]